ncbi:hypothetical protein HC928_12515 [bacterium]|nr:hypothetical protein [bacterium]
MYCKTIRGRLVVGLLLALMVLTGCSQKPEDAIIGTWQTDTWQDNEFHYTFAEDGNFYEDDLLQGEYWFEDDDTLSIGTKPIGQVRLSTRSFHFKFQGDTITLTPEGGGNMIQLTKIRN